MHETKPVCESQNDIQTPVIKANNLTYIPYAEIWYHSPGAEIAGDIIVSV